MRDVQREVGGVRVLVSAPPHSPPMGKENDLPQSVAGKLHKFNDQY